MKKSVIFLVLAFTVGMAFAKNPPKATLEVARKVVPETAKYKTFKLDDGQYEITFLDTDKTTYEVEVSSSANKVVKIEVDRIKRSESTNVVLTQEDIQSLVKEKFPNANNIYITLDNEDGNAHKYEVEFTTDVFKAEIDINPENGDFGDEEYDYF
ncbi:MAG: hypothetical protein HDR54_00695 [Treponema sp.]|nr:hypothetical protein [Treponema sp.]MBD5407911.1 hypothetical protein [Treponema sp.]MBD5409762.1 hypothetical protein [Treponema sp.]MBD5443832.1 hypothetical protein [Treponema sp.]MDE6245744.1 PepSY domain-containing protein [Treponemataceae bacterium]